MIILDGKKIKEEILDELKDEVSKLDKKPTLVVIQVGNDEASNVYIKQKEKMANYIGYGYRHLKLDEDIKEEEVIKIIKELNDDKDVHGIMVQMPLPSHIDQNKIQNSVDPDKDVDGLTDINMGRLMHNMDGLYSCTPYGIMEMLARYNIPIEGRHAVIVGRSNLVGKPMSMFLLNSGATVTICHSKTKDLSMHTKMADILVVTVGKAKLITEDMVRDEAVVIDVGINRTDTGLCGDTDFDMISKKASYITPVPGGVGPMTVAMLGKNVLKAYYRQVRE